MKLKEIEAIEIFITIGGRIAIKQQTIEHSDAYVFLTLDQFEIVKDWVSNNKQEIELAWNNGIEVDEGDDNG
jgi:hypothetical protein